MSVNFRQQLVDSRLDEFNASCVGEAPPPHRCSIGKDGRFHKLRAYASYAILCLIAAACGLTAASANGRSTASSLSLALGQTISRQFHRPAHFDTPNLAPALPKDAPSRKFYDNLISNSNSLRWSVTTSPHESVMHGRSLVADIFVVVSPRDDSSSSLIYLDEVMRDKHYNVAVCRGSALNATLLGSGISSKDLGGLFAIGAGERCL